MAKVFIEETTLTAIGDAIRGKEGTTALVPVTDMATRITDLQTGSDPVIKSLEITSNGTYTATDCDGYSPITVNVPQDGAPTDEELTITGNCDTRFANDGWNWVIEKFGNRITTKDITDCSSMFSVTQKLTEIPFDINVTNCNKFSYMFSNATSLKVFPKIRGTIKWNTSTDLTSCCNNILNNHSWEDLFTPEMLEGFSTVKVGSTYSSPKLLNFYYNFSLRKVPSWWYKFKLNPESTAYPSTSYTIYYNMVYNCTTMDELLNIPVWKCAAAATSNLFSKSFDSCSRLKDITFETNEDGTSIVTEWKSQTIDLSRNIGYIDDPYKGYIFHYNSGITADKQVTDDATYQALKNDPDWFTTNSAYSRYNRDSAVATINSLPDTSAYLATAGGTNTIKFKGASGSLTNGGAINTLTEEEIAVATAKGWTVTLV